MTPKKISLTLISLSMLCFSIICKAQDAPSTLMINKGNIFLNGNIGLNSGPAPFGPTIGGSISGDLHGGYFIANGLALGLQMKMQYLKVDDAQNGVNQSLFALLYGPSIRYYINVSEKIYPYLQANYYLGNSTTKQGPPQIPVDFEIKSKINALAGGLGLAFKLTDKLTFDLLVQYINVKQDADVGPITIEKKENALSPNLGFTLFF